MIKRKISFACTTLNEEKSIKRFLDSISNQSVKPNEIIIVDGGSKDNTIQIVEEYKKKSKIPIKIFIVPGANIARGRNEYVKRAKGDILFSGDLETRFEKDWIKKMLKGFDKGADIVIGTYVAEKPQSILEKVIASRFPNFSKFSENDWNKFLPSNRQIAVKLISWEKLGDFPEWIHRADDTLMHMKAKKEGFKYYFAKDAKVYWRARDNLKQYLKLAYQDSVSDGFSGIALKRKVYFIELFVVFLLISSSILSIIFTPLFILTWFIIFWAIFLKEGLNIYKKTKNLACFVYGGLIMILLFFTHALGGIRGILKKIFSKKR
jgi:glycosyltransferase involved in cell wall biosynthesis